MKIELPIKRSANTSNAYKTRRRISSVSVLEAIARIRPDENGRWRGAVSVQGRSSLVENFIEAGCRFVHREAGYRRFEWLQETAAPVLSLTFCARPVLRWIG